MTEQAQHSAPQTGGGTRAVRPTSKTLQNWAAVLEAILIFGGSPQVPLTPARLRVGTAQVQGLPDIPPSTLRSWTKELFAYNLIEQRRLGYQLGAGCGQVVGVALGTQSVRGGLYNANGVPIGPRVDNMPPLPGQLHGPVEDALERVGEVVRRLLEGRDAASVLGVALALPAPINREGYVCAVCHESWCGERFGDLLRKQLAGVIPEGCVVDTVNDANADVLNLAFKLARSQAANPHRSRRSTVLMTIRLSGGVGAGIMKLGAHDPSAGFAFSRSSLIVGTHGFAGEIGHQPMNDPESAPGNGGVPCSCGAVAAKHLEEFVSAPAVLARLRSAGVTAADENQPWGPQFQSAWLMQNAVARELLRETGKILGRGVASAVRLVDPGILQLTGTLGHLDDVKDGMRAEAERWYQGLHHDVSIKSNGGDKFTAVRGAALMVFRRHIYRDLPGIAEAATKSTDPKKSLDGATSENSATPGSSASTRAID